VSKIEWISVKDRLPEIGDKCVCFSERKRMYLLEYYMACTWCPAGIPYSVMDVITHWMPLPEPPEEIK
jgi:hypothetical protein